MIALRRVVGSVLALWLGGGVVHAEGPISLDVYRGVLVTTSRITGMGGAFTGVAEGIDGAFQNPASLANRAERSVDFFDYDLALDWMLPSPGSVDIDGDGEVLGEDTSFSAFNLGLSFQLGPFGMGVLATQTTYDSVLTGPGGTASLALSTTEVLLPVAWAFDGGTFILGTSLVLGSMTATVDGQEGVAASSPGWEVGALWQPREWPFRVGAKVRGAQRTGIGADPGDPVQGLYAPWLIRLGASWMVVEPPRRPYNIALRSGDPTPSDAREDDLRYLLLSMDWVLIGGSGDAVTLEGFLEGKGALIAAKPSLAIHLGVEGEFVSGYLRGRLGTYMEPVRQESDRAYRGHFTGGLDARLFRLWLWQIRASVGFDVAPGFTNLLIGVGLWN